MSYHRTQRGVAAAPQYPGAFREQVREAALVAMRSLPLTTPDSQLCRDLRREDGPYQFRALDRLMDLLATVPDEHEALTFIEGLRGTIVGRRQRNTERDLREDFLAETEAEGEEHTAVARVMTDPHPDLTTVQKAIDAIARHDCAEHRLLDDLFGVRFSLRSK
jgi:hypothetical protein